ncbi:MAG: hypothetical protein ACJA16_000139 [Akkermansiaceae bacterium]|jgi:hypothetical protein
MTITPRQPQARKEIAIGKTATGKTKTAAARAAGINRRSIRRWVKVDLNSAIDFDAGWTAGKEKRRYL